MTYEEVFSMLQTAGLPVAYRAFSAVQHPPFVVWISDGDNNFPADDQVYYSAHKLRVELYTTNVDAVSESAVESALAGHFYTKSRVYIDEEKLYETIYELEV